MWRLLLCVVLLTGDVFGQGEFVRFPASAPFLRPIANIHHSPFRQSSSPISGGSQFSSSRQNACSPTPCGDNTRCEINRNGIALCRCIADYVPMGNTIQGCKPQCVSDSECPDDYSCRRNKCERVCTQGSCGLNADCDSRNHQAICSCPRGYNGSPDIRCIRAPPIHNEPEHREIDPCNPSPCGTNANCRNRNDRAVCSCPLGSEGDPLTRCIQGECIAHTDCPGHEACQNLKCINPCLGVCGSNANCVVRTHQPVCSCPRNYMGDPFTSCRALTAHDICNPSPCGKLTNCRVKHDGGGSMRAVCSCIDNYLGNPLTECRPECVRDTECAANQHCQDNRCRNPCVEGCGEGAYCDPRNHRAICSCPEFFQGDPHSRCHTECTTHEACRETQACFQFQCIDPCVDACGIGADCKVERHTPICSCPRGYTGDPFISCRPFTLADLCEPNPCGTDADCQPGSDRQGNDRPVCTCPRGYIGNPLVSCQRGECEDHNECPDTEACYAYICQSPCYSETGSVCGEDARCKVTNHQPVCSCPRGYDGNPLQQCRTTANSRVAGRARHFSK